MRVLPVALVLVLALAGCAHERPPEPAALTDDLFVLDDDERREFERRLARELAAAPAERDRQLRANRDALDALPLFPGATVDEETHQGIDTHEWLNDDEVEYAAFVEQRVRPYARFELVTADRWATYRRYLLPPDTKTIAVKRHYARLFRGWQHLAGERGRSALGGHAIYTDDYWRGGRCVWVHIGLAESSLPAGRTLTVATMREPRGDCV